MIIKQRQLETKYGIKGKTAVHRQAWKEAYVGLVNRDISARRIHRKIRIAFDCPVSMMEVLRKSSTLNSCSLQKKFLIRKNVMNCLNVRPVTCRGREKTGWLL